MEESLRIASVDEDRNPQTSAFVPDRIQPRIVDRDQPGLIPHAQAQVLQQLQPASAPADRIVQLSHHFPAESGIVDFAPVDLGEHDEPPWIWLHHLVDDVLQLVIDEMVKPYPGKMTT